MHNLSICFIVSNRRNQFAILDIVSKGRCSDDKAGTFPAHFEHPNGYQGRSQYATTNIAKGHQMPGYLWPPDSLLFSCAPGSAPLLQLDVHSKGLFVGPSRLWQDSQHSNFCLKKRQPWESNQPQIGP